MVQADPVAPRGVNLMSQSIKQSSTTDQALVVAEHMLSTCNLVAQYSNSTSRRPAAS
jgi:hypothetical protein